MVGGKKFDLSECIQSTIVPMNRLKKQNRTQLSIDLKNKNLTKLSDDEIEKVRLYIPKFLTI